MRKIALLVPVVMLANTVNAAENVSIDMKAAIARGGEFKSRSQYLEKGLKANKVQLASAWALDGISKYVTFFTDFEAVAAGAAQAQQEMRQFTLEDAEKLPLAGLVYATVEIHGRGSLPVKRVAKRYVRNSAHLVVQYGNDIVQPLSKDLKDVRDASFVAPVAVYTWWHKGNISLLTGGPLGWEGSKIVLEFVFRLSREQLQQKGKVILIDGDGNRHQQDVDFSKVFDWSMRQGTQQGVPTVLDQGESTRSAPVPTATPTPTVSPRTPSDAVPPISPAVPQAVSVQAEPVRITPATAVPVSSRQAAPAFNGLVDVTFASNPPGALVFFNGMSFYTTPFVTRLQPGKYSIKMTLAGYPDWETEISVDAGKPATVVAQLNSTTGVVLK